jgi:transposase InsO family protein
MGFRPEHLVDPAILIDEPPDNLGLVDRGPRAEPGLHVEQRPLPLRRRTRPNRPPCRAGCRDQHEVRERRNQLRHLAPRPELLATPPNEVWSWDITKLLGPAKWTYYYLYVILDIFSRYVIGWMVAHAEGRPPGRAADRRNM